MKKIILILIVLSFCLSFAAPVRCWDDTGWDKQRVPYIRKTVAPAVTDDDFAVPYLWVDETNDKFYLLMDNTTGAAVWQEVQYVGGSVGGDLISDTDDTYDLGSGAYNWKDLYLSGNETLDDDSWLGLGAAAGRIEFDDQATDEVNILGANVGIGTASPGAKLEVVGTIKSTALTLARSVLPSIPFRDSDGTDADDNGQIFGDLTDTGSGTEDFDMWFRTQVAGTMTTWMYVDADGNVEIQNHDFKISGSFSATSGAQYKNISTPDLTGNSYTIASTDYTVLVDDDDVDVTGTVVVGLPAAASSSGRILNIKRIGSSQTVQLDGDGAETIDGAATKDLLSQNDSITIQCDGTGWFII
ncbi:MAG TPA: hypothetical protein ENH07_07840 [Nitrospirae bacterium]|nr:hypothetical protein [Nitrospirota bacterium]